MGRTAIPSGVRGGTRSKARQRKDAARALDAGKSGAPAHGSGAPIYPGLLGGAYRPLSERQLQHINEAALRVLAEIGLADSPPLLCELAAARGCRVNDDGRLCFPRSLIEDTIAGAARRFVLYGRDPAHDLEIGGNRVHYGTGGAAVQILDMQQGCYRPSRITDLYDFARLADRLDNVHWFTRCVIATEISDWLELDINTAYACAAGTRKHIGTAVSEAANVAPLIQLLDRIAGGAGHFGRRPFCKLHASPIVPPLRFGRDACDTMIEAVRAGMPINAITAAQSGATAPSALAGTLVQTVAETLAVLVFVNLVAPAHPFIFSNWPFVSDLRTGAFSGGGGEEAVLNAASAQIANYYDLPGGVAAGMADSKLPDGQAGYEKAMTTMAAGLAGANLVYESSGMLASLLGCSFESFVIDNEMLGSVLRTVRGIEVNDESLSFDVIAQAVNGPGHFLGAGQTLEIMESEYVYPTLGDRQTPEQWHEQGATDIRTRAGHYARKILDNHYPHYIETAVDKGLRRDFPIRLPETAMRAAPK